MILPEVIRCIGADAQVVRLIEALELAYWTPGLIDDDLKMLVLAATAAARVQRGDLTITEAASEAAAEQSAGITGPIVAVSTTPSVSTDGPDGESGGSTPDVPLRI